MNIEEKIKNCILEIQTKRGEEYKNDIVERTSKLNNKLKLQTLKNIIEFDDILYPSTINDESLEKEYLLKLKTSEDKEEIIYEILANLNISTTLKYELLKYEDILIKIKNKNE